MAHAPSGRNHRQKPDEELNIVPMIDMVTNLMFFLMMFASMLPIAFIDAPLPKVASTAEEVKKAKEDEKAKLEVAVDISVNGFTVKSDVGGTKQIPLGADGKYNYVELHNVLVQLHTKRPNAREITLNPQDDTVYDTLILTMDAARELVSGDNGFQNLPPDMVNKPAGDKEQFNRLFPDVSIGGV